ncbi:hypothetical protein IBE10_08980 [Francisella tularensis subsp. novicida]|uniref:hypothetical protein n=1 Tax=Francisella tularensis TaxID=263 RepID=UPI0008FCEF18|nr:hypothetical protein [Francisella tularensis]APC94791.1 hypothetical protein KX02_1101 [Francisella tularensis subsp. novicida]MBK2347049.1 hypothetical protein [Francisella tularensis subsp. novicida]
MNKKKVLCIGWDPEVVDYSRYPGVTPEMIRGGLEGDLQKLKDINYDAQMCYILSENSAVEQVAKLLKEVSFDIILVGAGVRKDDSCFYLFEKLVNVIHELAPKAKICFNTEPKDTMEAVQRWDF